MASFIKLFGVFIVVSMKASEDNPTVLPKRKRVVEVKEPDTWISEQLLEKVKSHHEPVFLYQRKLSQSDANYETLSRLFVLEREEFKKMLTEGEWGIVNGAEKGLENIVGIDTQGRLYKLGLNIWRSLKMLVINSEWSKLVKENGAKKDDWVQTWGHRDHIGNLCMAINFIKA